MQAKRHTRQLVGSTILRVLLVFAAWTGPVPYCHCHGSLLNAGESGAWLSEHLWEQHPHALLFAQDDFGWHLHFFNSCKQEEEGKRRLEKWISAGPGCNEVISHMEVDRALARQAVYTLDLLEMPLVSPMRMAVCSPAFYSNYASSLPMPLRFGVVRC